LTSDTVTLDTPVSIDITKELWVGYSIYDWGFAACDDGPAIDGYGNMITMRLADAASNKPRS
jgi:hypothetical protein